VERVKGLLILAAVAIGIGASLFWLLRESDTDLRRVEDDVQARLDECEATLRDAYRVLSGLRAIQPSKLMLTLERAVEQMRAGVDTRRKDLAALRLARPEADAPRGPFLDARKTARAQAEGLLASARQLERRITLLDDFTRNTEEDLRLMIERKASLFRLRQQLEQSGAAVEPALLVKIEQLAQEAETVRTTASQVAPAAAEDLAQAEILARTAQTEVERVLHEQEATIRRVDALLAPAASAETDDQS
jgi:hypothetical protein